MAEQHTPGPWKVGRLESYEGDTGVAFRRVYFPSVDGEIAEAHVRGENCDQNARLIAAAPDLLAALEVVTQILGQCLFETIRVNGQYVDRKEAVAAGRAATAKARGQV